MYIERQNVKTPNFCHQNVERQISLLHQSVERQNVEIQIVAIKVYVER
jgi:hypothetical protein